jgi:putative nucleotidyltransferase with HDIG domain
MSKQDILKQLFSRHRQLPTAPVLYLKFNEMISDPTTTQNQIANLILKDQSMMAKILRLSNSAMYSRRRAITNITNAITFLGLETLKNLILQVSLMRTFSFNDGDLPQFSINTFWEHSMGTAYFCSIISKKFNLPENDDYYLGGLLHDIGKLLIYQFYPDKFKEIVLKQINDKSMDVNAEQDILGVDHTDVGAQLAREWKFKEDIISPIGDHHREQKNQTLNTAVVQTANRFAKAAGLCFPWENQSLDIPDTPAWRALAAQAGSGANTADMETMVTDILAETNKIKESISELLEDNE